MILDDFEAEIKFSFPAQNQISDQKWSILKFVFRPDFDFWMIFEISFSTSKMIFELENEGFVIFKTHHF